MVKNLIRIIIAAFTTWLFLILTKKEFILWGQIVENFSYDTLRAHTVRNFVINGLITLTQLLYPNWSREESFNVVCSLVLFLTVYLLQKELKSLGKRSLLGITVLGLFPLLVAFFQNGRGIIGCFAVLILYSISKKDNKILNWSKLLAALVLSNVSSGIFSTVIISIFLLKLSGELNFIKKHHVILGVVCTTPLFIIYLRKNLAFYNNSILELLTHGFGKFFFLDYSVTVSVILLAIGLILAFSILIIHPKYRVFTKNTSFVLSALIGLPFGYTAFNAFIYPLYLVNIRLMSLLR